MSGLLEADIDLGLESGAAAFDPLYCSPPTHALTHTHTHHPPEQTELLYHRAYSTPPTSRGLCALAPLKVHVRFICLTFSPPLPLPRSRIQPALEPYGDPFLPFSLLLGRRFTHGSLARPTREQPCSSPLNSRGLLPAHPACASSFHPFSRPRSPSSSPFHLLLAKNGNNSSRCARPFPRADPFHPVLFPRHPLSTIWIEIVENGRGASVRSNSFVEKIRSFDFAIKNRKNFCVNLKIGVSNVSSCKRGGCIALSQIKRISTIEQRTIPAACRHVSTTLDVRQEWPLIRIDGDQWATLARRRKTEDGGWRTVHLWSSARSRR